MTGLAAPSLLGRDIRRGNSNVRAASTVISGSFVFSSDPVSQSGSLSGLPKRSASAVRHASTGSGIPMPFKGLNEALQQRRAAGCAARAQSGASALAAVAAGGGVASRGSSQLEQHLASAVAVKRI